MLTQSYHHQRLSGNLDRLRGLEARIRATARRISPDAPEAAILAARRKLADDGLAGLLVQRSKLPENSIAAPEPLRLRIENLERRILDLARDLEPTQPAKAILQAAGIAHRRLPLDYPGSGATFLLEEAHQQVAGVSRRLGRLAAVPGPSKLQRVHRTLRTLSRLDLLERRQRRTSEARRHLVFRGNISEIKAAFERIPAARDLLEDSAPGIYRHPDIAVRRLRANTQRRGLQDTLERFGKNPGRFGKLRGLRVPGLGDSPGRKRALELVWHTSGQASAALIRREGMEAELEAAVSQQRLQNETRELIRALPSREELLADLSRHMEGLELHEVWPLLRPGQAKLVQDVRSAEQLYLEPLRQASRAFRALDPAAPQAGAEAQKIAGLFQEAPRHVLRRLTPPQMQAALVANAMARQATKVVTRAATV